MKAKHSRRDFLRFSAAGAIGAIALSNNALKASEAISHLPAGVDPKSFGIGLQFEFAAKRPCVSE